MQGNVISAVAEDRLDKELEDDTGQSGWTDLERRRLVEDSDGDWTDRKTCYFGSFNIHFPLISYFICEKLELLLYIKTHTKKKLFCHLRT